MVNIRNCIKSIVALVLVAIITQSWAFAAEELFAPDYLWKRGIAQKTYPIEFAETHLGIPYRDDGAINARGFFTTFTEPGKTFKSPGLNCSGLVVSASRYIFGENFSLEQVTRDRNNNSGKGSPLGEDWDFGWDLILNLTDSVERAALFPDGQRHDVTSIDPLEQRGFDLHDYDAWQSIISNMRSDKVYLGTISRKTNKPGYKVLHYHVVLILPDANGDVWLYHSTRLSRTHKMNLNSRRGLGRLMAQFSRRKGGPKNILLVEASLVPNDKDAGQEMADKGSKDKAGAADSSDNQERPGAMFASNESNNTMNDSTAAGTGKEENTSNLQARAPEAGPNMVVNHLWGKLLEPASGIITNIPRFADESKSALSLVFNNRVNSERNLEIVAKGPLGDMTFQGKLPPSAKNATVIFPRDFSGASGERLQKGKYTFAIVVDNKKWLANQVEVTELEEAKPKITRVQIPKTVRAGSTFSVKVTAQNQGAESDYGGITVSCPDTSGLRIVGAKDGKVYGKGSTVLSVTSDKIKTKVPMAERWIDLWPEDKAYDMTVRIKALKPGVYPIYVRCALRGVNVKSSVVLMDPKDSNMADQQGFPVTVYEVNVQ